MTPKMTTSEAVYGRISTYNAQWWAATLTLHVLHTHYSAPAKRLVSHQPAVMLALNLSEPSLRSN